MDKEQRIEELESQVRQLNTLVRRLLDEREESPVEPVAQNNKGRVNAPGESQLVRDVRVRVGRALGGDSDDIETQIGGVWLSRLGVIVMMTALVFFARATVISDELGPFIKVVIGYGVAATFSAYGFYYRKARDFFAEALLGCGLATLYFTTYAIFFIENMRLVHVPVVAFPAVLLCLLFLSLIAHWRRSPTVAGIGLFLAYYTVALSAVQESSVEDLSYALLTCTAVAAITLAFHFAHRWLLFTWAALIATYITYFYFFLWRGAMLGIDEQTYFWISNGFLSVCYVLFSLAAIIDARKTQEFRKGVASMAGVNSFVFFCLTWIAIRTHYVEHEWIFRVAFAFGLMLFAFAANRVGPQRNYLYQIFIAKTIVMFTLALQAYFSGEKLLVAMAVECLGLAFSYRRSGLVTFKVMGLGLTIITFIATLSALRTFGNVDVGPYVVPANWFSVLGVSACFCLVAWFFEKFVKRIKPHERTVKGQWFLADTVLDVSPASFAIIHASAAALLLLILTILEYGDHPALPFLLFGEGVALALVGLLLRTPQIDVASVLLLVASHVAWHGFFWLPMEEFAVPFDAQAYFVQFTVCLALFTYVGAWLWERYLFRFFKGDDDLEHHVVAALPYLIATFLLATLLSIELAPLQVPAAQGALGMTLLLVGSITRYTGVKASGLFALGLGTIQFYTSLYYPPAPLSQEPMFLLYFSLFLLAFAGTERLLWLLQRYSRQRASTDDLIRTLLVVVALLLGTMGLYEWSPERNLIFWLLGYSVITIALGAIFRERRYRWGALFLFFVVVVRAFTKLEEMSPFYQVLTFAAPAAVLLIVSWFYTRNSRQRQRERPREHTVEPVPHDG